MLDAVHIVNFKSYSSAFLPLSPLTLLVGANAAGKTNCIEALRFLSRLNHERAQRNVTLLGAHKMEFHTRVKQGRPEDKVVVIAARDEQISLGIAAGLFIELACREDDFFEPLGSD